MIIKRIIWIALVFLTVKTQAQYKPDIIVIGGSAAGTAAAIQGARSGVKTLLIAPSDNLIGDVPPSMNIPAFDLGLWKEWKDKFIKTADTVNTTPQLVLESIVKNTKDLSFLKATPILGIAQKKNGWEVKVNINGKPEDIKCKVLVDATTNSANSLLTQFNVLSLDKEGKFDNLVSYTKEKRNKPYDQTQKLYRTSGAAGFGKDSVLNFIPLGVFIPIEKENLLVVSMSAFKDFDTDDFKNIALWTNMGQAVGALAAYGPFFDTTPAKANIRLTQSEMFTYQSFLYPVLDIKTNDAFYNAIQKTISTGLLKFDFKTGRFNPNELVKNSDIKPIMTEIYPRAKIWFIENKPDTLTLKNVISLFSFISGKDPITMQEEIMKGAIEKFGFSPDFKDTTLINKRAFAILSDIYLSPFNTNVDFNGYLQR
ncbi:FAD-dependent oxidoreductase [Pedobacter sp. SD-b]|uniref:FAD-dependent oxidoreductase n=1 Tax=Pedobacter segetis TaxID=2793069 RepID=A0ABS1BF16_9SPHI|nr:FAD-dependent oxidoreductase [Pedobacter segetis]MBK0381468.1 FAD-dependent oxidoreductase [Pedobacter segetis]